ncbi:Phospholipase A1 PLIP3, chloroplastic [Linum perenne]
MPKLFIFSFSFHTTSAKIPSSAERYFFGHNSFPSSERHRWSNGGGDGAALRSETRRGRSSGRSRSLGPRLQATLADLLSAIPSDSSRAGNPPPTPNDTPEIRRWTTGEESILIGNAEDGDDETVEELDQNWVMKILHVRSLWKEGESNLKGEDHEVDENSDADNDDEVCCVEEKGEDEIEFDRDSCFRLLKKASLVETKCRIWGTWLIAYLRSRAAASLMATTDSITVVVAAKEEVKQAITDDLSSTCSSPRERFICDDDQHTRYIVIQLFWLSLIPNSRSQNPELSSSKLVYKVANGIYEKMLPRIQNHLKSYGRRATFRFTGHSLGGSLSVLINKR